MATVGRRYAGVGIGCMFAWFVPIFSILSNVTPSIAARGVGNVSHENGEQNMGTLPTFNLACNIWKQHVIATGPPIAPADLALVPCNLQYGKKGHNIGIEGMWLLVPKGTNLEDGIGNDNIDIVECPAGSQRWYGVFWVDDVSKGFPTEYRSAELRHPNQFATDPTPWAWPIPYP